VHFHHGLTWHGSQANRSARPRRAIALHYMTEKTCFVAAGAHVMKQFAHVADGSKLEGDHFPLVWSQAAVAAAEPPELTSQFLLDRLTTSGSFGLVLGANRPRPSHPGR